MALQSRSSSSSDGGGSTTSGGLMAVAAGKLGLDRSLEVGNEATKLIRSKRSVARS